MNSATVSFPGTLVADPVTRQVNNNSVTNFRVAVQTDKKKEDSKYFESDFYDVSVWGRAGDILIQNGLKKLSRVMVVGSLKLDEYTDREGVKHPTLRVSSYSTQLLDRKSDGNKNKNNNSQESNGSYIPF